MKSLVFLLLFPVSVFAQNPDWLCSEWKVDYSVSHETGNLILKKYTHDPAVYDWGRFFVFHTDGTYTEKAWAPCGLDDNHYTYSGYWNYNTKTKKVSLTEIKVINDRPNIYHDYTVLNSGVFIITFQEKDTIQIKIEESWEKVRAKKEEKN